MKGAFPLLAAALVGALSAGPAHADAPRNVQRLALTGQATAVSEPAPGVQRIEYRFGPVPVTPGQNYIYIVPNEEKPREDGWITRIEPNLRRADGSIPNVDVIHLHHGVWLNTAARRESKFFASGEEKTIADFPDGFGLWNGAGDRWLMNHMIHNLTTITDNVWITYTLDFIPAAAPEARAIKPVRPVWMDVQNGSGYPVFDTKRGSGENGQFTYPDDAKDPYPGGVRKNEWTVDGDGVLVTGLGHVHPGGLNTDLWLSRPGATALDRQAHAELHAGMRSAHRAGHRRIRRMTSRTHRARRHRSLHRRLARTHAREHPRLLRDEVLLHRSRAVYFDPRGPVSWDMSMEATQPDWRPAVRKGDKLRISTTYETRLASWYESMGIGLYYMAYDESGADPFAAPPDASGRITHGHLAENENYGGEPTGLPDASTLPDGGGEAVDIVNFQYRPGDLSLNGDARNPPTVAPGQSLVFRNWDAGAQIYHSITACKNPCTGSTGISYPLADGAVDFDSGQLGYGPSGLTAAANRDSWETPKDLSPGTYTYFCRVHPFMRGALRVKG